MLSQLLNAGGLMALSVIVHAMGLTAALVWIRRHGIQSGAPFWPSVRIFLALAYWMLVLHVVEILCWGLVYAACGAMSDEASAFYFSAVTYTTTGYGDLVLPPAWRVVGAIEALTGILMCGWSTGFFFAIVSRISASPPPQAEQSADRTPQRSTS